MAYQVVICAVGIYFMDDALNFLKKHTRSIQEACVHHFKIKHKSVIVRKVGSYMTWIHAPKIHVTWRQDFEDSSTCDDHDTLKCNNCVYNDTNREENKNSVQLENRIKELEKELLRLQAQVSNILLNTDIRDIKAYSSDIGDSVVSSTSTAQPSLLPPPPPPPPPPPLPPTPLIHTRTLLVKVKPKSTIVAEKDSTSTIMEELSKRPPKLRHVERSPGGRPIRVPPANSDPSDILAAVLKKRFEAIHGENQDCYMLSPENSSKTLMMTGH